VPLTNANVYRYVKGAWHPFKAAMKAYRARQTAALAAPLAEAAVPFVCVPSDPVPVVPELAAAAPVPLLEPLPDVTALCVTPTVVQDPVCVPPLCVPFAPEAAPEAPPRRTAPQSELERLRRAHQEAQAQEIQLELAYGHALTALQTVSATYSAPGGVTTEARDRERQRLLPQVQAAQQRLVTARGQLENQRERCQQCARAVQAAQRQAQQLAKDVRQLTQQSHHAIGDRQAQYRTQLAHAEHRLASLVGAEETRRLRDERGPAPDWLSAS
jgi:DNA repair exonuclease SbcCD ATPase subunit